MTPTLVYSLCLVTCVACAALLIRAYLRSRTALLFWTAAGFVFLALNNLALVADNVWFPDVNFGPARQAAALMAVGVMIYGFIKDVRL